LKLYALTTQQSPESVSSLLSLLDQLRSAHDSAIEQNLNDMSLQLFDLILEVAKKIDDHIDTVGG